MATYNLTRTALPDLTFEGKLLTEQIGSDPDGATQGRAHDVRVYEADDGQFIVGVDYRTRNAGELPDQLVEAVDDLAGVDDFLSLYDPTERLNKGALANHESGCMDLISATLVSRFDRQVIATLKAIATSVSSRA